MKHCIDCNTEINTRATRCPNCRADHRKLVQKKNKDKYQYHKLPKNKYTRYKRGAERRGLIFNITYEEFLNHWQSPCKYCNDPIDTVGLDRIDNSLGYTLDNIVDCCTVCNFMKHKMSAEDFINKCKQIAGVSLLEQVD